jgi:hypothetical protein
MDTVRSRVLPVWMLDALILFQAAMVRLLFRSNETQLYV